MTIERCCLCPHPETAVGRCEYCGNPVCEEHRYRCEHCRRLICEYCLDDGDVHLCPACWPEEGADGE